jgi:hypothetical protein
MRAPGTDSVQIRATRGELLFERGGIAEWRFREEFFSYGRITTECLQAQLDPSQISDKLGQLRIIVAICKFEYPPPLTVSKMVMMTEYLSIYLIPRNNAIS